MLGPPPSPTPREVAQTSLADAFLRVERAGEHIAKLKTRIAEYTEAQKDKITVQVQGGVAQLVVAVEPPPRMLSVIVGETIQNLRTALDYLVYALAWLDSGVHQERTQFPIERRPEFFERRRTTYLEGVSDEHVAAIERLQPFDGGHWLGGLQGASNQDKHRALNLAIAQGTGTLRFDPVRSAGEGAPGEREVHMHHAPTIDVTFNDGTPVLKPLEILQTEVRRVLDSFKPDFEG